MFGEEMYVNEKIVTEMEVVSQGPAVAPITQPTGYQGPRGRTNDVCYVHYRAEMMATPRFETRCLQPWTYLASLKPRTWRGFQSQSGGSGALPSEKCGLQRVEREIAK